MKPMLMIPQNRRKPEKSGKNHQGLLVDLRPPCNSHWLPKQHCPRTTALQGSKTSFTLLGFEIDSDLNSLNINFEKRFLKVDSLIIKGKPSKTEKVCTRGVSEPLGSNWGLVAWGQ